MVLSGNRRDSNDSEQGRIRLILPRAGQTGSNLNDRTSIQLRILLRALVRLKTIMPVAADG